MRLDQALAVIAHYGDQYKNGMLAGSLVETVELAYETVKRAAEQTTGKLR